MGQNKRYPGHDLDRAIRTVLVRPEPIGLTREELDLENRTPTVAAEPIPVQAFIRFHEATIQPPCEAIAWTDKAVQVRFEMLGGGTKTVWVWASAVSRIHPLPEGTPPADPR